MSTRLQVIGGGKMGQALVGGMIEAGWAAPEELAVVEQADPRREELAELLPGVALWTVPARELDTLIAVKPHHVVPVCKNLGRPSRVLSIAAGVTIASLEGAIEPGVSVIRAMPNTPSLVGAGASAIAAGTQATEADLAWASDVLGAVGEVVVVPEAQLDAVTGLSGSGPAYVFLLAEALIDAGVGVGLTRQTAEALARQTIYGAGKLMVESGDDPVSLRAGVTTPAGTTAAGLGALEAASFRAAIAAAVSAATDRSIELGKAS